MGFLPDDDDDDVFLELLLALDFEPVNSTATVLAYKAYPHTNTSS